MKSKFRLLLALLLLALPIGASAQTAFITGETLGTLRSNVSEPVGLKFTVNTPIEITALGRWVVSGNSHTHLVALYDSGCGVVVSVTVNTSGAPAGQFDYVNLTTPIILTSGNYFLMTTEVNGQDQWYNDNTTVTTTSVATVDESVFATSCTVSTAGLHAFGPVSFEYTANPALPPTGETLLPATILLTSGTSMSVPASWNNSSNRIECIGGGGGGGTTGSGISASGGGGGAYSSASNVSLTPGNPVDYAVGAAGAFGTTSGSGSAGGPGGDSYFCNANSNCGSITGTAVICGAKGGAGGNQGVSTTVSAALGGAAASGIGSTTHSGGNSGSTTSALSSTGGGGAAGPFGNGGNGGNVTSASGGGSGGGGDGNGANGGTISSSSASNSGSFGGYSYNGTVFVAGGGGGINQAATNGIYGSGGGGGGTGGTGGSGGVGYEWGTYGGSGGGGGGSKYSFISGGPGAMFGGGGAAGCCEAGTTPSTLGTGAQGAILLTWTPTGSAYQGPCDLITTGCAEAYSVTRAMTVAYDCTTCYLFQLGLVSSPSTTLNVGQTSGGQVDLSTWSSFCSGVEANCFISKIYAQIHTGLNDLVPATFGPGGASNPCSSHAYPYCATDFYIETATSLPALNLSAPDTYTILNDVSSFGIYGGANSTSIMANAQTPGAVAPCCGTFGISHLWSSPDTPGTMIELTFGYSNTQISPSVWAHCSSATGYCYGADLESTGGMENYALCTTPMNVIDMVQYSSSTGLVTGLLNGGSALSFTPSPTIAFGISVHLGAGGDLSQPAPAFVREMFVTNTAMSSGDESAARGNMTSFYSTLAFPSSPACGGSGAGLFRWGRL